jgi:hypothetical protein
MSNNDSKLIWEAYEREHGFNGEPEGFARIKNEWENDILPRLEIANFVDDLDYNTNQSGLVIFFPGIQLAHEQNIDLDMISSNQVARLEREFNDAFGKYDFIHFEVSHQTDSAVEDAHLTHEGQWLGVGVYIKPIEVREDDVQDYFNLVLAVNDKAKQLSRG